MLTEMKLFHSYNVFAVKTIATIINAGKSLSYIYS